MSAQISFKAKVQTLRYVNGEVAKTFIPVPEFKRSHCDMTAFRTHPKYGCFANSDLFPSILKRIRAEKFPRGEIRLDAVPDGVRVDTSGFLAVVSFSV